MKTTGTPEELARLYKRMAEAMAQLKRLPKRGHNKHFNYDYVTDSDVLDAVRGALGSMGVAFFNDVVDLQQDGNRTEITLDAMFADSETGATVTVVWMGEALDSQDKGINKALTGAIKYGLLKTLLISTGEDDPDGEEQAGDKGNGQKDKPQTKRQQQPKATNGDRPYSPETVKAKLTPIVAAGSAAPATEKQRQLIAAKLNECFAEDPGADTKRYAVTYYLFGFESTKDPAMKQGHVDAALKWVLLDGKKDDTGDYPLHPKAPAEAAAIVREALIGEGQTEFDVATEELFDLMEGSDAD